MHDWVPLLAGLCLPSVAQGAAGSPVGSLAPRMAVLIVQVGILLLAASAAAAGCRRGRLPGMLGQLAAGVLLGPYLLGGVPLPGFPAGLFPGGPASLVGPELYGLWSIAAVVVFFGLGLRTDLRLVARHSRSGVVVGIGGALASFAAGDLAAALWGAGIDGQRLDFMATPCLFLGVASAVTSASVTARVLAQRRRLDAPEGVAVLAGAVATEIVGMAGLAVVVGVAAAGGAWGQVAAAAGRVAGGWLLAVLALALLVQPILRNRGRGREHAPLATLALGVTLFLAGLYDATGLAAIIGGYVVGLALSRTDVAQLIRGRLEPLQTLLLPLLFAVTGMLIDPGTLGGARVLAFALAYTALTTAAKVLGGGAPALLFGHDLRGALCIGVGLVPRGEIALVVVGVGLVSGALPQALCGAAILMTLLSTLCTPPLLAWLCRPAPADGERDDRRQGDGGMRFPCGNLRLAEWVFLGLQDTLQRDGFALHDIEGEGKTALALRGGTSIVFRHEGTDIAFSCDPGALAVVKTAVLYVVRELRSTQEALRRPLDVHQLVRGVLDGAPVTAPGHDLKPYLRPDLVKLRLRGTNGPDVLREMVGLVQAAGLLTEAEEVLAGVVAREQSMSTGLERGIAVPHCRTDAVDRLVCAVGLKPEGVDFGAFDGQPSRVFVLTLSPISDPTPHVQFMSQVTQVLTPAVCRRLLRAESTHEVIAILSARPEAESNAGATAAAPARLPVPQAIRSTALTDAVVVPRLRAASKEDAIEELLGALAAVHPIEDVAQVRRQLLQREQVMSTGLERGIAVPHCRTAAVGRVLCAIGLKPEGLDFGSQDGAPAQIIVLILASTSMPTPYAQTLAVLLHALNQFPRSDLFACADAGALRSLILRAVDGAVETRA